MSNFGGGHDMIDTAHGSLVDRHEELEGLTAALGRSRLVSVVGPGGVGKTRVAMAVSSHVAAARTWWIELAAGDTTEVPDTVAGVVGDTRAGTDVMEALVDALSVGPGILVLDNCEHVVERVGEVATFLLASCPQLRVLVTSRVPLGLEEEEVFPLAPLLPPVDGADFSAIEASPAVALFAARARAASPDFEVTIGNSTAVADICRHLDGLPLAIELAAARVQSITPVDMAQHLDDRLQLLRRHPFHRSGRHRSLVKALSWSYELLSPDEQQAFDRLSVFTGTFTTDAAAEVTGIGDSTSTADLLESLVARSMLIAGDAGLDRRYRVLETLGEFGRRNLQASDDSKHAFDALRRHYLALVEDAAVGLQGPDEAAWADTVHRDLANVRTVFTRAINTIDVDTALRLVVALFDFAFYRMRREVGVWAEEAVALPGSVVHHLYGAAAGVAGYLAWQRGAVDDSVRLTESALAHSPTWVALDSLGTIELFKGRVDRAIPAYTRAAALAASAHNDFLRSIAMSQLGFAHVFAGADDAADVAAVGETLALSIGNPTAIATATWAMGTALFDSDPHRALEILDRSMELCRGVDNRLTHGAAATTFEELHTKLGKRPVTADLNAAVGQVEYWMRMGNLPNLWLTVRRIARALVTLEQFETAAVAFGAESGATSKLPLRVREGDRHETAIARTEAALGFDAFAGHAARGALLSPEALVSQLRAAADALLAH